MITASNLAGFLAAHAIWSVSDGETLIPILGYTDQDDKRILNRLASNDLVEAVNRGKRQLLANPMDANDAVLVYDGRMTLDARKLHAIRVHKPKLLVWKDCEDFDMNQALQAFWDGVSTMSRPTRSGPKRSTKASSRCMDGRSWSLPEFDDFIDLGLNPQGHAEKP